MFPGDLTLEPAPTSSIFAGREGADSKTVPSFPLLQREEFSVKSSAFQVYPGLRIVTSGPVDNGPASAGLLISQINSFSSWTGLEFSMEILGKI